MSNQRKAERSKNPLAALYQILCNAAFEDEHGANITLYNALMLLGAAIDKQVAADIDKKISEHEGRYKYDE